jgi:hypothetical protein
METHRGRRWRRSGGFTDVTDHVGGSTVEGTIARRGFIPGNGRL